MAVKYLDNAGTQYLVNKIKAIDGKIPTESQITTMITSALNTYKEGIVTIVESLPQTGEEGKLYLMVDPSDSDVYIIYTWEENAFKRMGSKTFTLTVDSALSATSTNPVQNKVIKTALDGKANSSHTHGSITNDGKLGTASRVVITGTDKKIGISSVTTTELGYLSGVTSAIQTQLNSKSATGHTHTAGDVAGLATVATSGSYNDLSNKPSIPIKISDLQDDVDMLTSHEDLHLENLPNESPNIRFINNSPQITWNDYVYHDPATTLISGPSYEFDDETSLTSKSKIGYTNSSNSQNTIEHIYGQTYGTTKSFFTMKYYYGSNEKNAEEDESCTINSSLVFTLDPNYYSAGADTYYDESNAYSDVSPNNENYFLGRYRPFKEIRAKDFMIALNGYDFSLSSGFDDIYTHTEDTDIHVTASDKTTWNAVTSKANDSDVVHKTGDETSTGFKQFSNIRVTNSIKGINLDSTTTDLNNCYSDFAPYGENKGGNIQYYYCNTDAGTANISNLPESKAFFLTSITTRLISNSLYVKQILINSNSKTFVRYCNNSTWSSWVNETDSEYVHKSGDESITGTKTFGNGTLIVNNSIGNNVHGEIKLYGSRPGYIVADNASDGVFDNNNCGVSILLQDIGKPLHIGGYKVDSNGRVFVDNTNKNPVLSITSSLVKTSSLVPENDTGNSAFRILSQLDYANGNPPKVLDVRFIQYDNANATSAIYSNDDGKTSLGATAKRWSGVYATNYYYGNDNVEFSTKFVTSDTAQTISGEKTFNDLHIIGYGTQYKGARNAYILPEFSAGYSGLAITTLGFPQTVKIGNFVLDANNKPSLDTSKGYIQIATGESNGVNSCVLESRNSTYSSLGTSVNRWSKIYGTEYYYGSNNVEFSTKFVTTDTAQTISGTKTFADLVVYNSDTTAYASYLSLKNQRNARGSSETGVQGIQYLDKNGKTLTMLESRVISNGNTGFNIICYNIDGNNQSVSDGVSVIKSPTTTNFAPTTDNAVTCGRALAKWSGVYSTEYYYGANNTPFTDKFVTTDTNQTINSQKIFSVSPIIYNSDSTATTPQITFKNSKVAKGSTTETGAQLIYFTDKNNEPLSIIESRVIANGNTSLTLKSYNFDTSNNSVSGGLQVVQAPSGTHVLPTTDETVSIGNSIFKWSDVATKRINNLAPSLLGMPDLSNGIDISSYITVNGGNKESLYTPPVNGWISIALTRAGGTNMAVMLKQGSFASSGHNIAQENGTTTCNAMLPVKGGVQVSINSALADGIDFAYFYPCLGNV